MATVIERRHSHHVTTPRTTTQKVCIGLGIFFIIAGLGGIIMPGMLGMHLSMSHNVIHLASGALSLWTGYSDDPRKAYNFALSFGVVYGLLGLGGFVFGEPGYPGVGHMEADENLLRVIPNVLEFGTADHTFHGIISAAFLVAAFAWKKRRDVSGRSKPSINVYTTPSENLSNYDRNLKDASPGQDDVNRRSDINRRTDFEKRV